jgi:hypothetical protein
MLKKHVRNKHSNILGPFVNYNEIKEFYCVHIPDT